MLQRSLKQVLAILAVSMFAVAGAPAPRGDGGGAGREHSVKKGTPVVAGIIIQEQGWDSCVVWDIETGTCLDGGGGTGGTPYTCAGVTCEWGCSFHLQRADMCEYHGKHENGHCTGNGDPAYWHEHAAKLVL